MSRRSEQLYAAVDQFNAVHDKWVEADRRPNPDTLYWDALDELIETFSSGDVPAECVALLGAVNKLAEEFQSYDERDDPADAYPADSFWEAREALAKLREQPVINELKPLETIQDLDKQKVSHRQIARMYGLYLPNGEPATHLVQRELDKPGSVIGPDWADPRLKEHEAQQRKSAGDMQALLKAKSLRAAEDAKPCPESPRDLWEQKVSVAQSAKMLRVPMAEVQAMFEEFERERKAATPVAGGPLPEPEPQEESDEDDTDEFDVGGESNIDQEIIELHREGMATEQIKKELSVDGRKVAAVIRKYEASQETANA